MGKTGIDRMTEEQVQLSRHKGPYWDKWMKNYAKWVKEQSGRSSVENKMFSRWTAGMNAFVQHPKGKHDNT